MTVTSKSTVELWKNTANGMRWYIEFDVRGAETTKTVTGGRTFTISTLARQVNQERAASPDMDLFRNGTFLLVKESDETNRDEIESPESITDEQIETMVNEVMAKNLTIEEAIKGIESVVTLQRIYEQLVVEDASKAAIDTVKAKISGKQPTVAVEREYVATSAPMPPPRPERR